MAYVKQTPVGGTSGNSSAKENAGAYQDANATIPVETLQAQQADYIAKKTAEYKKLINDITVEGKELVTLSEELSSAVEIMDKNYTGGDAADIKAMIEMALCDVNKSIGDLNAIGKSANEKINELGVEKGNFTELRRDQENVQNQRNNTRFSCDTELLRKEVLPLLKTVDDKLDSTYSNITKFKKVEGCGDTTDTLSSVNDAKRKTSEACKKLQERIEETEQKEKENIGLIAEIWNKAGNLFGKLFNKSDKEATNLKGSQNNTDTSQNDTKKGYPKTTLLQMMEKNQERLRAQLNKGTTEKVQKIPLFDQRDYYQIPYGSGHPDCGLTDYAMLYSYFQDEVNTPDMLLKKYPELNRYKNQYGTGSEIFVNNADKLGGKADRVWGWDNETMVNALKNGQPIVCNIRNDGFFTDGGHYIILTRYFRRWK